LSAVVLAEEKRCSPKFVNLQQVNTSFSLALPEEGEGQGEGSFLLKPRMPPMY
jgi:hypothetical protein